MSDSMAASEWKARKPIVFETPNGDVAADRMICAQIKVLGENVEAYVLDDSPDVLTRGRRCQEYGYGFHWNPFSCKPYFVSPDGDTNECVTLDDAPYIPERWNTENAPVLESSGQAVCRTATISAGQPSQANGATVEVPGPPDEPFAGKHKNTPWETKNDRLV